MQDWGYAYQEHQRTIRDELQKAKDAGVPTMRLASGPVDPRRLSYGKIARVAMRDAEHIINMAINQELERQRKKGK